MVERVLNDLSFAVRTYLRAPGFLVVAVLTIAVGVGATTAIFSVVNAVLLRPLPFPEPEQLVFVRGALESRSVYDWPISPRILLDMRERVDLIPEIGGLFTNDGTLLNDEGEAVRLTTAGVTPNLFSLLGVRPALGRDFRADDASPLPQDVDRATVPPTAVILSHETWRRHFGGDPAIIGRFIQLAGDQVEVVGVMEPGFQLLLPSDSRYSSTVDAWSAPRFDLVNADRRGAVFEVIGRLADGTTLAQAQAEMDTVTAFEHEVSEVFRSAGYGLRVVRMHNDVAAEVRPIVLALLGAVTCVLLIACANVSSLLLVRASARVQETAIRSALGASRSRLVRQLLTESLMLSLMGAAAGVVLAFLGTRGLLALGPPEFPRMESVAIDAGVLGFTLAVSIGAALLFGLAPAVSAARSEVAETLKQGGRSGALGRRGKLRTGIVMAEVALSVVLLIGAGLMIRSFIQLQRADPGFDTESALTFQMQLQGQSYRQDQRQAFVTELRQRLGALAGVETVSAATLMPLLGNSPSGRYGTREAMEDDALYGQATYRYVYADYFRAMGTRLLEGRVFDGSDFAGDGAATVVVDELVAARLWPAQSPVGETLVIRRGPEPELMEVIGVVEHQRSVSPAFDSQEAVYFNARWAGDPRTTQWIVRTAGTSPTTLIAQVRAEVAAMDPQVVIDGLRSLRQTVWEVTAPTRFALVLIGVFAMIALALAIIGVYGVLAYVVRQRTPEIGLRMVLGAPSGTIVRTVVRQGIAPTLGGLAIGLLAAYAVTQFMSGLLVRVEPTDPVTFAGTALLFMLVALLASLTPARRATRIDPLRALRDG